MRTSLFLFALLAVFAWASAVDNANRQCQLNGHAGSCFVQELKKLSGICENLKCASNIKKRNLYVPTVIGPALPGTICGVSQICNAHKQCVPTLNVPHQVGPADIYNCA